MLIFLQSVFIFCVCNAQGTQIPKVEFEYKTISKHARAITIDVGRPDDVHYPPTNFAVAVLTDDLNAAGKEGWELVSVIQQYSRTDLGNNQADLYTDISYILKRVKPINEQQFYARLDEIAKSKVDSAMTEIKRFLLSTLNQSTKELFSTEYGKAMKEAILLEIKEQLKTTVQEVIKSTGRPE